MSGRKPLTAAAVERFKPGRKRREIPDARTAGLHLVIQPSGTRSWALRFRRPDGRPAKLTLGTVDFSGREIAGNPVIGQPLTLAAARALAADIHRQRKMGRDVVGEHNAAKHRRRVESEQAVANSFGVLARQFIEEHAKPNVRRWKEVAVMLGLRYSLDGEPVEAKDGLAQRWADKPITEIDAHFIYQTIDEAKRRGVPGRDRRTKGLSDARGRSMARTLSKFFSWLVEHRKITANPTLGVHCPPPPPSRERTLSSHEVRWLWRACERLGFPFGPFCQGLLVLGCRREELRGMRRAEIGDDGLWNIPASRSKNRRSHDVSLPEVVRSILDGMPRIENEQGFVFTTGRTPLGGFSKYKTRLDRVMLDIAREERGNDVTIEPFVLHDLRRTAASGMQRIGIRVEVIERCLNHVSGSFSGVAGIYQRDPLLEERRAALEQWAAFVQRLVSETSASTNVVAMSSCKGA